jgi:hypothetical protein
MHLTLWLDDRQISKNLVASELIAIPHRSFVHVAFNQICLEFVFANFKTVFQNIHQKYDEILL